jgi:hypothetical protein
MAKSKVAETLKKRQSPPPTATGSDEGYFDSTGVFHYNHSTTIGAISQVPKPAKLIFYADIEERDVDWFIYPFMPRGEVTILSGKGGLGKSIFSAGIVARASVGGDFPAQEGEYISIPCGNVLYLSKEDDPSHTLKPRFVANGANCSRIATLQTQEFGGVIQLDSPEIASAFETLRPVLAVIDPIQSYTGGTANLNHVNQVRAQMEILTNFAHKYGTAILVIMHLNKSTIQNDPNSRIQGSVDFVNSVRSVITINNYPDVDLPDRRAIIHTKHNLSRAGLPVTFDIGERGAVDNLQLETEKTNGELLAYDRYEKTNKRGRPSEGKTDEAMEFLSALLTSGVKPVEELKTAAERLEIAWRTVERAKSKLNAVKFKSGTVNYWRLE